MDFGFEVLQRMLVFLGLGELFGNYPHSASNVDRAVNLRSVRTTQLHFRRSDPPRDLAVHLDALPPGSSSQAGPDLHERTAARPRCPMSAWKRDGLASQRTSSVHGYNCRNLLYSPLPFSAVQVFQPIPLAWVYSRRNPLSNWAPNKCLTLTCLSL